MGHIKPLLFISHMFVLCYLHSHLIHLIDFHLTIPSNLYFIQVQDPVQVGQILGLLHQTLSLQSILNNLLKQISNIRDSHHSSWLVQLY